MITAIKSLLQRRREARRGPWCACFDDRDQYGTHCLLEPANESQRPASPVRCQGNGCWTP